MSGAQFDQAQRLVRKLYELGASLSLQGERLAVCAPAGSLDAELLAELRAQRAQLGALLASHHGERAGLALPALVSSPELRHEPFPFTDIQQAYWVGRSGQLELGAAIHVYAELEGELDVGRLTAAWLRLVERHEMLRAVALADGRQQILPFEALPVWRIPVEDLSGAPAAEREARLAELRAELSEQVIDLTRFPAFELRAVQLDARRIRLFVDIDCTFLDSWAVQLLFREWVACYRDPDAQLSPPRFKLSFRDYVLALQDRQLPLFQRARAYWQARLSELPPAPRLPLARSPEELKKPHFKRWAAQLPAAQWAELEARARRFGLTAPVLLIAAFSEVLAHWAESPHFTLNVPLFNRHPLHPEVVRLAGNFSSFTLLEVDGRRGASFSERALLLRAQLWRDLEHRFVSGVDLLRQLFKREGGISRAIMPVVFTSFASDVDGVEGSWVEYLGEQLGELVYSLTQTPQVWLDHQAIVQPNGCFFNWDAALELFPAGMIDEMFACYCALLDELAAGDAAWTRVSPSLAAELRARAQPAPEPEPLALQHTRLQDAFFAQAERAPERLALVAGEQRLSYAQLRDAALALASELRALGAPCGGPVALLLDKGWEQVVAVLGVLAAGASWLPLDPELPRARLEALLERAQVTLLVTRAGLRAQHDWPASLRVLQLGAALLGAPVGRPQLGAHAASGADDVAAVIFTSGSTGAPNAAQLTHRGLVNAIQATGQRFSMSADDVCLGLTALHHDMSIFDIFGPLGMGGCLVLPEPAARRDPARWTELMLREGVTVWNSVPALLEMLVSWLEARPEQARPTQLRLLFSGGDWIPLQLPGRARALFGEALTQVSVGGPTETTLWNIWYPIEHVDPSWTSIPYGKPLPNTRYWVMDEALCERPSWVPGELCCTGVGVARGYLGDAQLSASKFVRHPRSGEPMYRTGDRGRLLPDGNIEFLGRVDDQLSIGGYRIEPAEIEAALARHPEVAASAVVACGARHDKYLVAHVVARAPCEPRAAALRDHLLGLLPEPMVPHVFALRAALPLTANGKVDRRRLAAENPAKPAAACAPRPSSPQAEAALREILRDVIGLEQVDLDANFFELGAHSVHLVRIHAELHRRLGVQLPLTDLFKHPRVSFLVEHLASSARPDEARERLRARAARPAATQGAIAVVGMAARFPGAPDLRSFWDNIAHGRESVRRFGPEELRAAGIPEAVFRQTGYVPAAAVLEDIDLFDAAFFGVSEADARLTDPQNRLFLETAWQALEDAGWAGERGARRVGVYAGKSISNYLFPALDLAQPLEYFKRLFGNDKDFIASSVSYLLDLRGPSVAVHTACSTSLVAIALACQALCAGDCDIALAGGVSVKLPHHAGYLAQPGHGMFAPDGHCRPFDARGAGLVPGSGSGAVVLRRLQDAERDRDHIYAVIRGWATNNDGGHKVGFTAPDADGQAEVVAAAQQLAGVRADEVALLEAHGTATPVGDPIEVEALTRAFELSSTRRGYCRLGSVKANIGHLDSAAGVAGFIKAALAIERRTLPPSVNFSAPNPRIDFSATPFVVAGEQRSWSGPRRVAGVSSFGVGGTNAHVVLEQSPANAPDALEGGPAALRLVGVSARSETALAAQRERLTQALAHAAAPSLADVALSAMCGRRHFERRAAWVGDDRAALQAALQSGRGLIVSRRSAAVRPVAWLFSGFGDQQPDMGRELYASEPCFRAALDTCAQLLEPALGYSLLAQLYPGEAERERCARRLREDLALAQSALFALQWALASLWRSWGLTPGALLGHSIGEYAAACVAGVFELPDALRLVAARGRLMQELGEPGETYQVKAAPAELASLLAEHAADASIAAYNAPRSVVVSGRSAALRSIVAALAARGVETRLIASGRAAHSPLMTPMLDAFAQVAASVTYSPPRCDLVSTVSGALAGAELATPEYWVRQVREPVQLAQGFAALSARGIDTFLELGPAPALLWSGTQCVARGSGLWLASLRPPRPERAQLLGTLASLYVDGARIDWEAVHAPRGGRRVSLPSYPFERRRYWLEGATPAIWGVAADPHTRFAVGAASGHPLLARRIESPALEAQVWSAVLTPDNPAWLADHKAGGRALLPGAALIELGFAVAAELELGASELTQLELERALIVDGVLEVQTLAYRDAGGLRIELHARPQQQGGESARWTRHARLRMGALAPGRGVPRGFELQAARARSGEALDVAQRTAALAQRGTCFGPSFQGLRALWRLPDGALGRVEARAELADAWFGTRLHPALLDACLQTAGIDFLALPEGTAAVPVGVARVRAQARPSGVLWARASVREPRAGHDFEVDVDVVDDAGSALLEVRGLGFRYLGAARAQLSWSLAWRRAQPALPSVPGAGHWLVLGGPGAFAEVLVAQLGVAGQSCVWVDADAAPDALRAAWPLDGVVYAGGLELTLAPSAAREQDGDARGSAQEQPAAGGGALLAAQRQSCEGLRALVRALSELGELPRGLWVLTRGARSVNGREGFAGLVQAPSWGVAAGIALEHPRLRARCLDLDPGESDAQTALRCACELLAGASEPQLALRAGERLAPRYEPITLAGAPAGARVPARGRWLLAGGSGRVGALLAEWLVHQGARELVLLSRTAPSPSQLAALRALGCEPAAECLDIADDAAVAALTERLRAQGRPLAGVVHAAGALADGPLLDGDWERFAQPLRSKLAGAWNLAHLVDALACPEFVLISSSAGGLPEPGQASYGAANLFLDELAARRRSAGLPARALAFGPWAGAGSALADTALLARAQARGLRLLPVETCLALFGQCLADAGHAALLLADVDWALRSAAQSAQSAPGLRAVLEALPPARRRSRLSAWVQGECARVLGIADAESVDPRRGFAELGMDSLAGLQLRNTLQELTGGELPIGVIYERPNVEALSELLAEVLGLALGEPPPAASDADAATRALAELSERLTRRLDADGTGSAHESA